MKPGAGSHAAAAPVGGRLPSWKPSLTLLSLLFESEAILCVSHVAPDGDAVGSLLGMGWILRYLGKQPLLALPEPAVDDFAFVPGFGAIVGPAQVGDRFDLIVCLDASSPDRMGRVYRPDVHGGIPLVVIDHHITNTYFGTENWVEPGCAATCQMLVYLAEALDVPLTGNVAVALLTGLVTDTLGFRTSNTDAQVLAAAMRLMSGGADLSQIVRWTLQRRSYGLLKLWGATLPHVCLEEGVIWTTISAAERTTSGMAPNESDGLSNFLITVKEADISATFTQKWSDDGQEQVECSFRAKPGFDVSGVAFTFGGGGHPPAAGCTVPGSLEQVTQQVVAALQATRREQRMERTTSGTQ